MPPTTPTRQSTTGPSLAWLDNWIANLPDLPENQDSSGKSYFRDLLAKEHLSGIRRLLSDAHVRGRLSRYSSPATQDAIKTLLAESSWVCETFAANSRPSVTASRTDVVRDIEATARTTRKLLKQFHELPTQLTPAWSLDYLTKRHKDGNPPGFSAHRRLKATHTPSSSSPTLNDLLTSLAADLEEEVALRHRAISNKRQKGGKWASLGGVIAVLSYHTQRLTGTGTPDFELMADILALLSPSDETPPADTLRREFKRRVARKIGKLASSGT